MFRYKLTIEYHGGFFNGWQRQQGQPSVQQVIEEALENLTKENDPYPRLFCAGRTDTGVHAFEQVAHVDLSRNMEGEKLLKALNYYLSNYRTTIVHCENLGTDSDFHARFDCISRSYIYKIANRASPLALEKGLMLHVPYHLDAKAMHDAAQCLIGKHDLSSFRAAGCQANSPLRSIDQISVQRNEQNEQYVEIYIEAKSFLYHQVRNIVGSLLFVGQGKWNAAQFKKVLEAKDRTKAGPTAPADGLYFYQAKYAKGNDNDATRN